MNIIRKDATIENTDDEFPGSFQVVLSTPAKDRDGDELAAEDWKQPLPEHITFDIDHGMSVEKTVGSGKPYLDDQGRVIVDGTYSSLKNAQDTRTLVKEGHIRTVSVAFMSEKETKDGKTRTVRELLNGAFVAIPSNREALVLASKGLEVKAGARHSAADMAHIQAIADHARALGAAGPEDDTQAEEGAPGGKAAKPDFTPIPNGTHVTWHYRGAVGHGTVIGVHKLGTDPDSTEYSIQEHDHHVSETGSAEKPVVYHFGSALTVVSDDGKSAADVETKAKYDAEQIRRMIASGEAMPDGSYPIADRADLGDAIRAVGRGNGSHDAIRRHIMARADALDEADAIPDNWNSDGSLKSLAGAYLKEFIDADATVGPGRLALAVDASLDDCLLIINQLDRATLPPQVQQLCDTVTAAAECVDQLLDAMGVDDPDDLDEGAAAGDAAPADAGDAAKSVDAEALELQYQAMSLQLAAYTAD